MLRNLVFIVTSVGRLIITTRSLQPVPVQPSTLLSTLPVWLTFISSVYSKYCIFIPHTDYVQYKTVKAF